MRYVSLKLNHWKFILVLQGKLKPKICLLEGFLLTPIDMVIPFTSPLTPQTSPNLQVDSLACHVNKSRGTMFQL